MTLVYVISILKIIVIDIVLSGDNAVVIAMAAHKLPAYLRQRAVLWGGGIAIVLRILFTMVMAYLMMIPWLRLIGGFMLAYIACKLLSDEEEEHVTADNADQSALSAIKTIFVADFVMSLDNMLAVAGASHGDWLKLLFGLIVSIAIIMTCSGLIAKLMNRFKWIVYLGAAILAFTAGEMIAKDREVARWIVGTFKVNLNHEWEEHILSHTAVKSFDEKKLPAEMKHVVEWVPPHELDYFLFKAQSDGKLEFIGRMSPEQKMALEACVADEEDRKKVDDLYEAARQREVPAWVPTPMKSMVDSWIHPKWPASEWEVVHAGKGNWFAWVVCGLTVVICMTSPRWWPKGAHKHKNQAA